MRDRAAGFWTGFSLLLPITLSTMAIVLLAPIVPQLMSAFGDVPNADYLVPTILTVPALCIALFSLPAGALGDLVGRRRLLLAALGIYSFVGVMPVMLDGLVAILMSRVLVGMAEAVIVVTSTALIADYFDGQRRERWLAAQTAFGSLSALLFFNLGGFLGQFGWRTPFWTYGSALAMLVLVLAFTGRGVVVADPGAEEAGTGSDRTGWAAVPWVPMSGIVGVSVFGSVLFYAVLTQASTGLAAHGIVNPADAGFLTSIASLAVPLGTFVYSRMNAVAVARLLFIEFLLMGAGFVVMSVGTSANQFLAGCAINQLGAGMLLPTLLVWAMRQLDFPVRGKGTGLWQSAFALGQFLSPLLMAWLVRQEGDLLGALRWFGYAALAAAAAAAAAAFVVTGARARRYSGFRPD